MRRRVLSISAKTCGFLGLGGTGKSHLAQAIGQAAILQGRRVLYCELHVLLEDLADAVADGSRKQFLAELSNMSLLILAGIGEFAHQK